MGSLALALATTLWGPPKLPPLPGERAEPEPSAPAQTQEPPESGTTTPRPAAPPPRKPMQPTQPPLRPSTWSAPQPAPQPTAGSTTPASPGSAVVEPPQPSTSGPQAETEVEAEASPTKRAPPRSGPGAAPTMGGERLPSEDEPPPVPRMPPPRRPPYSGVGLFVGAGVTFSAALAEQIVAHVLVKRRCIDPFAEPPEPDPMDPEGTSNEAEDFGQALLECAPGVLPAIALRVHSDLGLLATIGLASAGAVLRARQRAYDDVFAERPARRMLGLRVGGIGLISAGVVTWLTTGAVSWGLLASCRDARCATRARVLAFTTRDAAAVLITTGSGMVSYSLAHGRAYDRFFRDRALSVGTALLPGGGGLSLSGRF